MTKLTKTDKILIGMLTENTGITSTRRTITMNVQLNFNDLSTLEGWEKRRKAFIWAI